MRTSPSPVHRLVASLTLALGLGGVLLVVGASPAGAVAPTVTMPGPITMTAESTRVLTGPTSPRVADPDSTLIAVTIRTEDPGSGVPPAAFTLSTTAGIGVEAGSPTASSFVRLRGAPVRINQALEGMGLRAADVQTGTGRLVIEVDDRDAVPGVTSAFTKVVVTDVAPTATGPSSIPLVSGETSDPTGARELHVADLDSPEVEATLSVTGGPAFDVPSLLLRPADLGPVVPVGSTTGVSAFGLRGAPADIDAALQHLLLTGDEPGAFPLTLAVDDVVGDGGNVVTATTFLKVTRIPPVLNVPTDLVLPVGTTAPFASAPATPALVSDRDSTHVFLRIEALVLSGPFGGLTFSLPSTSGLTIVIGQTSGSTSTTIGGPPAAVDAAVRAMTVAVAPGVTQARLRWTLKDLPELNQGSQIIATTAIEVS